MSTRIAFVTYETAYAPCGGIAAVMSHLPARLKKASKMPCIMVTPFHHKIAKTTSLETTHIGEVSVPFDGGTVAVDICRYDNGESSCYFLRPDDERFFAGERHPYDVGKTQSEIGENLRRDSIFFGAAVARSLAVIAPGENCILMLQDWEAATTALAISDRDGNHEPFLTLHNSYDSGPVGEDDLRRVGINPEACPGGGKYAGVLQRALPLVEHAVFTVSKQFAVDFIEDTFQTRVMAPHLQDALRSRIVGIDNGAFASLAVPDGILAEARRRDHGPLREWKTTQKRDALDALDALISSEEKPVWGDISKFKRDDAAWFVMAGRDDPRQKGYDVAARAIEDFLGGGGEARFLFFPIPGDEGRAGLNFLKELSERFPESVLVLPFIFKEGFFAALRGATYGVMPSFYEPFGMANEFYLNGTVGIGRATGGIIQQIVPLRDVRCFTPACQARAGRWHTESAQPTGILYREPDDMQSVVDDWIGLNAAGYNRNGGHPDRVEERAGYALFRAMSDELQLSIANAVRIYTERPETYYRMLTEGIDSVQRGFSWERSAREYSSHIT